MRSLHAALGIVLLVPAMAFSLATQRPKPENGELAIARFYLQSGNWPEAEAHFLLAAHDPDARSEALAGFQAARTRINRAQTESETAPLAVGNAYLETGLPAKAQDLFAGLAANPALQESTRAKALAGLKAALAAQEWDRFFDAVKNWGGNLAWVVGLLAALLLLFAALRAIGKRRQVTVIQDFVAPKDELAKGIALKLKYARATMRNPALSAVGAMPAPLVKNLFLFEDELPAIEDLDLAGTKLPFAALTKLFGEPRVQVSGGFDGQSPKGLAYAEIRSRRHGLVALRRKEIRVGTPSETADTLDFAYDVVVRTSSI